MRMLKFFPSSDIMNASMLKNFQLKELHFEHPNDLTWWEKPVFHGARALGQNLGIANHIGGLYNYTDVVIYDRKIYKIVHWFSKLL